MEALTTSLLYLNGVTVSFDGFRALNNLSFAIEPGEMRAIIGPNGAGKTTMMDVVTGKTRPDLGDVMFDGVTDLTRLDETRIAELGIGRKFQKPTVFESQTIQDNLLLALNVDHRVKGTLFWRETKPESERIEKVLETIRLKDSRHHRVARARRSLLSARRRLSSTVWLSNTVGFWNLRPMPSSAIALSSSRVRSISPQSK